MFSALARRLNLDFIDSDEAIETAAGAPAGEVFERYGEASFRDGERRLVARLIEGAVRVIATGGGAFVEPRTRLLLNARAITVWLNAPIDILVQRTARRDTRPLLKGPDATTILARLSAERDALYAEAHIHVTSSDGAHEDVVEQIVVAVQRHLGERNTP